MNRRRKVWQHDVQRISEDQFCEFVHSIGWEIDPLAGDYGEDFWVRVFQNGNPTGQGFYAQLKGTRNIQQYARSGLGAYSYAIEVANLKQWHRSHDPVILVLWNIDERAGYWLHLQPFIEQMLLARNGWWDIPDTSHRQVHIPFAQSLQSGRCDSLRRALEAEHQQTELARQYRERLQNEERDSISLRLVAPQPSSVESRAVKPLPPNAKHQIDLARCQATIAEDPFNASAWLEQAVVYYDLNDLSRALAAVNKAWDLGVRGRQATSVKACVIAEYALANGGPKAMLREAMQLFESLRTYAPASAQVDYNIGNCLAGLAEYQAAVDHFDVALRKKPKPALAAQIWKNRGTCLFHLGQHDEEARSYQRALELDPGLWEAYASWAATELRIGEYLHAKELLERCLQVNPDLEIHGVPQVYSLAYALWHLGEEEEAYKRASQVLKLSPLHQDAQLLAAHLLSDLWRSNPAYIPDAIAFFEARLLDEPEGLFERGELYLLHRSLGRREVARKIIEEAKASVDAPPQTLYHYAMLLDA